MSEGNFAIENKNRPLLVALLATIGLALAVSFLYLLDSIWFLYTIKNKYGNLIATLFLFSVFVLFLCDFWQYKKKNGKIRWVFARTAIGVFFAIGFIYMVETSSFGFFCMIKNEHEELIAPIFFLLMSAPLSYCLWSWRNKDKLKQIDQSDEQSKFDSYSNAINLLVKKDNKHANAVGLRILAKIKNESEALHAEIDIATSGADLKSTDLTEADLTSIDLSRAKLENASLPDVNLANAKLIDADLSNASLIGTNLTGSNLTRATLKKAWVGIYKDIKDQKFSREEIETHLRQDWKTKATKKGFQAFVQIFVEKNEKNEDVYYFEEDIDSPSGAPGAGRYQPDPKPIDPQYDPAKSYKIGGARWDSSEIAPHGKIDTRTHKAMRYCDRGLAKLKQRLYDAAIADFDEAIKLDPNYAPAYRYRGVARMRKREGGKK